MYLDAPPLLLDLCPIRRVSDTGGADDSMDPSYEERSSSGDRSDSIHRDLEHAICLLPLTVPPPDLEDLVPPPVGKVEVRDYSVEQDVGVAHLYV